MAADERYVLLGLAPPQAPWFDALAHWTTSAAVGAEFDKCLSGEQVRARFASGRRYSALIVDSTSPALDRDLVAIATAHDVATVVVRRRGTVAPAPGAAAELPEDFGPALLLEVLAAHCRPVSSATSLPPAASFDDQPLWLAPMFTVCGAGGTGASTAAISLAQGLSADVRYSGRVLLADLARRADQAMLHDSLDLGPGLQEVVESHRLGRPSPAETMMATLSVPRRGYSLLLGLRQPEAWAALRPRAVEAALASLRQGFRAVVADVTGDLEGEAEGGSADVEERNYLARTSVAQATVTVAVGQAGLKGIHTLGWLIRSLVAAGAPSERIVAVINRSARHPAARAESARALQVLLDAAGIKLPLAGPVHLPERKLEDAHRSGAPLPEPLVTPLLRAVTAVAERNADLSPASTGPTRITPGSLGTWAREVGHG